MDRSTPREEAERWLGIALKLLTSRDFLGSKTFAIRARDSDPNNHLSNQLLAVVETVLAGENRVNPSNYPDWYTVLQLPRLVRDPGLIANNYRRLTVLLNPETNRLPFADYSLQLVMDAWSVLSDPTKKWIFDNELALYLQQQQQQQQQQVAPPQPPPQTAAENNQVNVFQFFQSAPPPEVPAPAAMPVWQQQPEENQSYHRNYQQQSHSNRSSNSNHNHNHNNHNSNQLHQIEFLQPQIHQPSPSPPPPHDAAAQWQIRVPTPVRGERSEGMMADAAVVRQPAQPQQLPFGRQMGMLSPTQTTERPPHQQLFRRQDVGSAEAVLSPSRTAQMMAAPPLVVPGKSVHLPSSNDAMSKPVASGKSVNLASDIDAMMHPWPAVVPGKSVTSASNIDMMQAQPGVVQAQSATLVRNIDVMMQPPPVVNPAKSVTSASNIDVMMRPRSTVAPSKSVTSASSIDVMMQAPTMVVPPKSVTSANNIDGMMQSPPAVVPSKLVNPASNIDFMMQGPPGIAHPKSVTSSSNINVMMQPPPVVTPAKSVTSASNNQVNISDPSNAGAVHENSNNDNGYDDDIVNDNVNVNSDNDEDTAADEINGVVECFWTACPYCFYIFEYQKKYQDCTLRCQNCRRCFHGLRIPTPPSIGGSGGGGGKDERSSFRSWGCFPLGFSKAAWKKNNQMGKTTVVKEWNPFSPMFSFPLENGGGKFKWVSSNDGATIGPKNMGTPLVPRPRVYVDNDDGFVSNASDSDSSDRDWRVSRAPEKMRKKRKGNVGGFGQPKKVNPQNAFYPRTVVLCLTAGATAGTRRKVAATRTSNQTKRKVKKMDRLDLNVEFNNEGDERAPRARAPHGEEDGIENIGFFEGLDEFFSTLPILNVGEEEKAKQS